jgi:hypothetical protein
MSIIAEDATLGIDDVLLATRILQAMTSTLAGSPG